MAPKASYPAALPAAQVFLRWLDMPEPLRWVGQAKRSEAEPPPSGSQGSARCPWRQSERNLSSADFQHLSSIGKGEDMHAYIVTTTK